MDSTNLTRQQAATVGKVIGRQLRYLGKLQKRMDQLPWDPNDPLYRKVLAAFNAVHALNSELHYLQCDPGTVGKPAGDSGAGGG